MARLVLTPIQAPVYAATLDGFLLPDRAGLEACSLFETNDRLSLHALFMPGFYIVSEFDFFLRQLATVADRLLED
jgi:hypothetical protein